MLPNDVSSNNYKPQSLPFNTGLKLLNKKL